MDKKNIILLVSVVVFGFAIMITSIAFLLREPEPTSPEPTTPSLTLPNVDGDLTIPDTEIDTQIQEIDKTGFDSQTLYWVEKLEDVCDLASELNNGKTLESLCEKYFPEEYREYKESFLLGDDQKEEYPADKADALYSNLVSMAEHRDFAGIIMEVDTLMREYKFTMPYNYKIGDIYHDATVLKDLKVMSDAARVQNIGKLKTPEMMVISAVYEGFKEQCAMYAASNALCFPKNTRINIQSVETYTVSPNSENYHEKMMNTYFNTMSADLPVTKITFVIDFDRSVFDVYSFGTAFEKNVQISENINSAICIFDASGTLLYDLGVLSDVELEALKKEKPEYAVEIDMEISRRDKLQDLPSGNNQPSGEIDENFEGMISPDEYDDNLEYDFDKYERFKTTVFEVHIPQYKLANNTYNRIYTIQQVTNPEIQGLRTLSYYRSIYRANKNFAAFINNNQWSRMMPNYDLADQLIGSGTPD